MSQWTQETGRFSAQSNSTRRILNQSSAEVSSVTYFRSCHELQFRVSGPVTYWRACHVVQALSRITHRTGARRGATAQAASRTESS